ncbi:MAG: hypothetical protein K1X94_00020 [Sandaracinaceae bacterium]|nr:hypothetical protein [Sandaracinaceae bacterium]
MRPSLHPHVLLAPSTLPTLGTLPVVGGTLPVVGGTLLTGEAYAASELGSSASWQGLRSSAAGTVPECRSSKRPSNRTSVTRPRFAGCMPQIGLDPEVFAA